MIDEIRERIQNKAQYIENVKRMKEPSSAAISVRNVCMDEVAFLQEVLTKMKELQGERDLARYEVVVYCDVIRTKNDKIEFLQKEIAELQSDLNLYIDLCDKKDEWLQYYKERAELAERSSNERTN